MKKYALFAFYENQSLGGYNDYIVSSLSFDFLFSYFRSSSYQYGHILDIETLEVFYLERE